MILATRVSLLALRQAELVKRKLEEAGEQVTILPVTTKGDRDRIRALSEIGGDGLFVRELERVLLSGEADLAVHCGKDLPYCLAEGLVIGGVPMMADARDCLISRKESGDLPGRDPDGISGPGNSVPAGNSPFSKDPVGTGSPRRTAEYLRLCPDAEFAGIRGNINTRIRRLREGAYGSIILAKAGLDRLEPDLSGLTVRVFSAEEMIPAPCQGILAAECRADDKRTAEILRRITDPVAARRFEVERYLFGSMKADCSMAVGIHAEFGRFPGDELPESGEPGTGTECRKNKGTGTETECRKNKGTGTGTECRRSSGTSTGTDRMEDVEMVRILALFGGKRTVKCGPAAEYRRLCGEICAEIYG